MCRSENGAPPHARGSTVGGVRGDGGAIGSPAHAGIDRTWSWPALGRGLPRTGGDRPEGNHERRIYHTAPEWCSPACRRRHSRNFAKQRVLTAYRVAKKDGRLTGEEYEAVKEFLKGEWEDYGPLPDKELRRRAEEYLERIRATGHERGIRHGQEEH